MITNRLNQKQERVQFYFSRKLDSKSIGDRWFCVTKKKKSNFNNKS